MKNYIRSKLRQFLGLGVISVPGLAEISSDHRKEINTLASNRNHDRAEYRRAFVDAVQSDERIYRELKKLALWIGYGVSEDAAPKPFIDDCCGIGKAMVDYARAHQATQAAYAGLVNATELNQREQLELAHKEINTLKRIIGDNAKDAAVTRDLLFSIAEAAGIRVNYEDATFTAKYVVNNKRGKIVGVVELPAANNE